MQPAFAREGVASATFIASDAFERLGSEARAEYLARRPGLLERTIGHGRRPPYAAGSRLLEYSMAPGLRSIDSKLAAIGPGRGGADAPHLLAPPKREDRLLDGVFFARSSSSVFRLECNCCVLVCCR